MKKITLLLLLLSAYLTSFSQIKVELETEPIEYVFQATYVTLDVRKTEKDSVLVEFYARDTAKSHDCGYTVVKMPVDVLSIMSEYPIDIDKINSLLAKYGIKAIKIKE